MEIIQIIMEYLNVINSFYIILYFNVQICS